MTEQLKAAVERLKDLRRVLAQTGQGNLTDLDAPVIDTLLASLQALCLGKEGEGEPDYFYDRDRWEATYEDLSEVEEVMLEDAELGAIFTLGRLKALPDQFGVVAYEGDEDGGSTIVMRFDTLDRANAFRTAMMAAPASLPDSQTSQEYSSVAPLATPSVASPSMDGRSAMPLEVWFPEVLDYQTPLRCTLACMDDMADWIERTKPQGVLYSACLPALREGAAALRESERLAALGYAAESAGLAWYQDQEIRLAPPSMEGGV